MIQETNRQTWADMQKRLDAMPQETREVEYRRGYCDGFIAAVMLMDDLRFLRGVERISKVLFAFWKYGELAAWLKRGRSGNRLEEPPDPPQVICSYCGKQRATQLDHVIPKSRGGSDDDKNLIPACQRCNYEKKARTPDEWQMRWYEKEKA